MAKRIPPRMKTRVKKVQAKVDRISGLGGKRIREGTGPGKPKRNFLGVRKRAAAAVKRSRAKK